MRTGMTVPQLAAEVDRQQKAKRDFKASTWIQVKMLEAEMDQAARGHSLEIDGYSDFPITPHAHNQIGEFCGIRRDYYERMRTKKPGLLVHNVNTWFADEPKTRLIRTLDGQARGFVSSTFRTLDNYDLVASAMPTLLQHNSLRIESCNLTPTKLYLKAVFPRLEFEVRKGDIVQFGLVISNSEVGDGSLSVALLVFKLACLNGMILPDSRTRKAHLGRHIGDGDIAEEYLRDETRLQQDRAFFMALGDTIRGMLTVAACEDALNKMRKAALAPIRGNPVEHVELVARRMSLNDGEKSLVMQNLIAGGDLTQWGIINAITATAQEAESYDRATELETIGGKILELNNSEWQQLAHAA